MNLVEPQRTAVVHDGHALVVACPGSGKTRTLVAKLLRCADEIRGTARRVACITYTNAGVNEIEHRLRLYGATGDEDICDISTIHSFCLNNILRYFYWKVPGYRAGFTVLPPDSDRFKELVRAVCAEHDLEARAHESFENLNREPDGTPIAFEPVTQEAALDFWRRLEDENCIDFPNIVFFSYWLLANFPSLKHGLACRYAWILVDEFQDTSALQVELLSLVASEGLTKYFLVGDPFQSIFGFAGARPDLMNEFANRIGARQDFRLHGNFRSSEPVIEHAERLYPREPRMSSVGEGAQFTEEPQYIHSATAFEAIMNHFLPLLGLLNIEYGCAAVLSSWWIKLLHLGRRLRERGIPIVGPGARPYRRIHPFALLAEQICAYIEEPNPAAIRRIERELFVMLNNFTGGANFGVYTFGGRSTVFHLVRIGQQERERHVRALDWLRSVVRIYADVLCERELLPHRYAHLLIESVDDMESDMVKNDVDVMNLGVRDLGMFASSEGSMKLLTMHKAKGREFDAVAIVDLHDGKVPNFRAKSIEEIDEGKRLLYVAITRARRILFYCTDEEHWRNQPSRFLRLGGLNLIQ